MVSELKNVFSITSFGKYIFRLNCFHNVMNSEVEVDPILTQNNPSFHDLNHS